ncbi:type VI secretion system Vgr family protein [Serratia sp. (in: enterobacteria)]|uniref:type VI secretion system Vgr family protein n=1 Tax=Serratia sp. (in: enterobacteria) TaxID=616 RepID=UPI00398982ED
MDDFSQPRVIAHLPEEGQTLLFYAVEGTESLSSSFIYTITLLSQIPLATLKILLGKTITLEIPLQHSSEPRYINGFITHISQTTTELKGTQYQQYILTAESVLWPMKLDRKFRIYQEKTAPEIVKDVCERFGITPEIRLSGSYRSWGYCVQYGESSFNFICRMLEHEGIFWWFRHEKNSHTLVLSDSPYSQPVSGYETISWVPTPSGSTTKREGIRGWTVNCQTTPGISIIDDYDFRKPYAQLLQSVQNPVAHQPGSIPVYEWPGRLVEKNDAEHYAHLRQERWQIEHEMITGTGSAGGITTGYTFTLAAHPSPEQNKEYFIISSAVNIQENVYTSGGKGGFHSVTFTVIPTKVPFRPARTASWPRTQGPQTARVVGPAGESIWTDKYGRIKVRFHWDTDGPGDDTGSCWIRVASPWAGQGYGGIQIPRVNDEVIVDFINGDPDRPVVLGRVYNEANMPPWELPAAATQMGFFSRSKDGGKDTGNGLRFEDKAGGEQVWINAHRNMDTEVKNDATHAVGNNLTATVGANESHTVEADRDHRVKGNETVTINGNRTETIKGNETVSVDGSRTETVKGNETLSITGTRTETITDVHTLTTKNNQFITVEGKQTQTVMQDRKHSVQANETLHVTGRQKLTVDGNQTTKVVGKQFVTVDGKLTEKYHEGQETTVTGYQETTISAGRNLHVTGKDERITVGSMTDSASEKITLSVNGSAIVIDGSSIEIQAGGSVIKIDASGVAVNGTKIKLNA